MPEILNDGTDSDVVVAGRIRGAGAGLSLLDADGADRGQLRGARGPLPAHDSDAEGVPQDIDSILAPLSVRYFDPSGFFAARGRRVCRPVRDHRRRPWPGKRASGAIPGSSTLPIGYRLPKRRGIVSLEFNNILDQNIHWQDDSFRSSEQQNRRFIPERSAMVRLNLNF